MKRRDSGGSAFPSTVMDRDSTGEHVPRFQDPGMTLRDYFAGQALAGMNLIIGRDLGGHADVVAETAYSYADAMLRAREATS